MTYLSMERRSQTFIKFEPFRDYAKLYSRLDFDIRNSCLQPIQVELLSTERSAWIHPSCALVVHHCSFIQSTESNSLQLIVVMLDIPTSKNARMHVDRKTITVPERLAIIQIILTFFCPTLTKSNHATHHPLSQPAHPAHTRSRPYTAQLLQTGLRQDPQALSSTEPSSTSIASSSLNEPSQSSHRGSSTIAIRCCGICRTIGTGCSIRQKLCSVLFCGSGAGCSCCSGSCS